MLESQIKQKVHLCATSGYIMITNEIIPAILESILRR